MAFNLNFIYPGKDPLKFNNLFFQGCPGQDEPQCRPCAGYKQATEYLTDVQHIMYNHRNKSKQ